MRKIPEGAKVKFTHLRMCADDSQYEAVSMYEIRQDGLTILPRGGLTECRLTLADGTEIVQWAECSIKDNYSKRIGRDISLGRALAYAERQA